ncbi:MAG: threonine synthase [Candidatus Hydrogenedentes bacterium]|nr:threonine synthase [Candidatus Hydrogenedentota bacterium]
METSFYSGLKCRECERMYPKEAIYVCDFCFGPLEVVYDYDKIRSALSREIIEARPQNMWRYRELLPVDGDIIVGREVGFTPLIKADRLAKKLGVRELWIKNDTVNYPTLSFKDRVVSVALSRAVELGFKTVACASTGNLANSVAANAAAAGLRAFVFIPSDLESGKVLNSLVYGAQVVGIDGTYDNVNRLCSEIAGKYDWAFVNVNLRPYYAEGSKTMGFEIAEQLGWKLPDNVVVPMASGSLLTKIDKSFREFQTLGLVDEHPTKIYGAQAENCSPIVEAIKAGTDLIRPVENPDTIVKSLAIGNPADGFYSSKVITKSGGYGENPTDAETIEGIQLLAEYEGIFSETAGGVTVAGAKRLIETGKIASDSCTVLCITGHGLKTKEAMDGQYEAISAIQPNLNAFEEIYGGVAERSAEQKEKALT